MRAPPVAAGSGSDDDDGDGSSSCMLSTAMPPVAAAAACKRAAPPCMGSHAVPARYPHPRLIAAQPGAESAMIACCAPDLSGHASARRVCAESLAVQRDRPALVEAEAAVLHEHDIMHAEPAPAQRVEEHLGRRRVPGQRLFGNEYWRPSASRVGEVGLELLVSYSAQWRTGRRRPVRLRSRVVGFAVSTKSATSSTVAPDPPKPTAQHCSQISVTLTDTVTAP